MPKQLHKKAILKETAQVGILFLFSKFLGIIREILQVSYLGITSLSDAFNIAFRIPNSMRKIFAEGALSAAFVPTLVRVVKQESESEVNKLVTLLLFSVSSFILLLCLIIFLFPQYIVLLYASGFADKPIEFMASISLLRVLIFFIFFISTSTLLAGVMQAKQYFVVPAWGPIILNIPYILGLLISRFFNFSPLIFSFFILLGGLSQLLIFFYFFKKVNYRFEWPDKKTFTYFYQISQKFLPCMVTVGIMEINLILDGNFASTLPSGSITLVSISYRFMQIILGTFVAAFSSILLSHFSHVATYTPKRLSYYMLESAKFIFWITFPVILFMSFFSFDIFYTSFYQFSEKFDLEHVNEASILMIIYVSGLFFYALNRVLSNIYYSIHVTLIPTIISFIGAFFNVVFDWILIKYFGAFGLAVATVIASMIQTILFISVLHTKFNFVIYLQNFGVFLIRYLFQLLLMSLAFYLSYKIIFIGIKRYLPQFSEFLLNKVGLWFWIAPLTFMIFGLGYSLRKVFKIKIHFLD